jgi:hypothetical protein
MSIAKSASPPTTAGAENRSQVLIQVKSARSHWITAARQHPSRRTFRKPRLVSFGFSLLLQPQDVCAQLIEPFFGDIAERTTSATSAVAADPLMSIATPRSGAESSVAHCLDSPRIALHKFAAGSALHTRPRKCGRPTRGARRTKADVRHRTTGNARKPNCEI